MYNYRDFRIYNIIYLLNKNYLIKSFSLYSLAQGFNALTSFFLIFLYTRHLSPAGFGEISLIWTSIIITSIFVDSRLASAFTLRFYKSTKKENIGNIYTILIYNIGLDIIIYLTFFSNTALFSEILGFKIELYIINTIFLLILFMVVGNFYTNLLLISKLSKKYFNAIILYNFIIIISSYLYLHTLGLDINSYLQSYLISYVFLSLLGLKFIIYEYKPNKINAISISRLISLLKISLPLIPDSLLMMLLFWIDRYMLNVYSGMALVGIYSVAYQFSSVIGLIINPFGQALSPVMFESFVNNERRYKKMMSLIIENFWMILSMIIMAYFTFLNEIYQIFLGQEYLEGYNIILILILALALGAATNFFGTTLIMKERTKFVFIITFIAVLFDISLNFILIPRYNIYGAAISIALSYGFKFILTFIYSQKLCYVNYNYKYIIKSIFISSLFLSFTYSYSYMDINIILRIIIKLILFILFVLVAYKYLKLNDLRKAINYAKMAKE